MPVILSASQRKIMSIIIGQSNEAGAGPRTKWTTTHGVAINTPSFPSSFHIRLAEKMALRKNIYYYPFNGSIGASSLPFSFCGCFRTWSNGMAMVGGLATGGVDGHLYQCDDAIGSIQPCTVQPTGGANYTAADGRAWKHKGATLGAIDVDQHVYLNGERGFDPKTQLTNFLHSALTNYATWGFDEAWVLIQIGQTDAVLSSLVTQQMMADSYVSVALDSIARGASKVFIGNTIYCGASGIDATYGTRIKPARTDALSTLSGNPAVYAGADLRTLMGVLPVVANTSWSISTVQLEATGYHMNDIGDDIAANHWYNQFVSLGVI